ncbi:MAG: PilZ domain-containing protein [Terracidiphilus sp.]|jgi:hypothetical protein
MHRFEYREPRFTCDLPVRLTVQDSTLTGRCTEIGKAGMKLEIEAPPEPNSFGKVSMSYEDRTLEVRVRLVHVGETHAGLDFIYSSDKERQAMANLVETVAVLQCGKVRTF